MQTWEVLRAVECVPVAEATGLMLLHPNPLQVFIIAFPFVMTILTFFGLLFYRVYEGVALLDLGKLP